MSRITKKEIVAQKELVLGVDRKNLLPASKYTGMRDFLGDFVGYRGTCWLDARRDIMESLELEPGGHFRRTGIVSSTAVHFEFGLNRADDFNTRANYYDLYLCADGRIRYRTTPEIELKVTNKLAEIAAEYERMWQEMWAEIESCPQPIS